MVSWGVFWSVAVLGTMCCCAMWLHDNYDLVDYQNTSMNVTESVKYGNWCGMMDYYPEWLTPLIHNILYLPNVGGNKTMGEHMSGTNTITLYANRDDFTLLHELGHKYEDLELNASERAIWRNISISWPQDTITDYADKNWAEDFAETFECYLVPNNYTFYRVKGGGWLKSQGCRQTLKAVSPARWKYMNQTIKRYLNGN